MTEDITFLFKEPAASRLVGDRIKARRKRKLTYDCMNAVVDANNPMRVVCRKGYGIRPSGRSYSLTSMRLTSVLRGMSSSLCQKCPDRDEETDE